MEQATIRQFVSDHSDLLTGRVLDYGCGTQPYSEFVQGTYFPYDRVSLPGSVATQDYGEDAPLFVRHAEEWKGRWEAILCTQVLQYVDHPQTLVNQFHDALVTGGHLVMTGPINWPVVEAEDLWRFTLNGAMRLMERAGFLDTFGRERHSITALGETYQLGWGVVGQAA